MTLHLSAEEREAIDALVELWRETMPEGQWNKHRIARAALEVGVRVMTRKAEHLKGFEEKDEE